MGKCKRLMLGAQLEKEIVELSRNKADWKVLVKLRTGRIMYPNCAFGSYVDSDTSDQYSPDIALVVEEADNATITVGDLHNSLVNVRKYENALDQLEVVIYFYRKDENGERDEYPDEFPVEKIEEVNGRIELVCNDFANLWRASSPLIDDLDLNTEECLGT